ncbi:MAG: GNAT superfamily N-acetyltransferase [Mariniblastus sp.]|jgi:GNAT superfamily N-acetyltransferase
MSIKDYCVEATLHDGSPVLVRAIRPTDKSALQTALNNLSVDSKYFRFFYPKQEFSKRELEFFTELDFERHVAIGVELQEDGESLPIGIARYIVDEIFPTRAEVAFTVADEFQGLGVGSMLLDHLVILAVENGINEFFATTFQVNQKMLRVFERSGLPMQRKRIDDVVEITMDLC